MSEDDWLSCTRPTILLQFLRGSATDRERRLFAVGWVTCATPGHMPEAVLPSTWCWAKSDAVTDRDWLAATDPALSGVECPFCVYLGGPPS